MKEGRQRHSIQIISPNNLNPAPSLIKPPDFKIILLCFTYFTFLDDPFILYSLSFLIVCLYLIELCCETF